MKRWHQRARLGIITVASCVLLVTVLPQVATSIGLGSLGSRLAGSAGCSSGSSAGSSSSSSTCCTGGSGSSAGSSSSQCPPVPGAVSGKVAVTGAPRGFAPAELGVGACPETVPPGPPGPLCPSPVYALAVNGAYRLSLPAGTWRIDAFYEIAVLGGVFLGSPETVTVPAGQTIVRVLTVAYRPPATLKGMIRVTGVPAGTSINQFSVLLCPSYAPYTGFLPSIVCVTAYGQASGPNASSAPYEVTGMPPGAWTAYPGFCWEFSCETNAASARSFKLAPNRTTTVNVSTPLLLPGQALLTGTVTVTGAPAGFADPVGVMACQGGNTNCQSSSVLSGSSYDLLLSAGDWQVNGLYLVPPFYNAVVGPTKTVHLASGHEVTHNVTVPYQMLGTAAGTIKVTGVPKGVGIRSYTMLACPAADAWTGGEPSLACVTEYSGPGGYGYGAVDANRLKNIAHPAPTNAVPALASDNVYQLPTLTAGPWILYPGYSTIYSSYTDPSGTTVSIVAGQTTTTPLTVPYQAPSVGVVAGNVSVVGVPGTGFQSGVQACSAPPTATTCLDEQDTYNQTNGQYQLALAPGTWWVSGFVEVFGPFGTSESTTPPRQVTVSAGSRTTENFVVTVTVS